MMQPLQSARRWVVVLAVVATLSLTGQGRADDSYFRIFPDNATHSSDAVATAIANVPLDAGVVYDADGNTDTIQIWNFTTLVYVGPIDITSTSDRIRMGFCMSAHPNDGGFFN